LEHIDLFKIAKGAWRVKSDPTPMIAGRFGHIESRGYEVVVVCHCPALFGRLSTITTGRIIKETESTMELTFAPEFVNLFARLLGCTPTDGATRQLANQRGRGNRRFDPKATMWELRTNIVPQK
jgi:hypothetical protein